MAGRGRGRGRGGPGSSMSFTSDQLNAMGLSGPALRAELNQAIIGPPLTFPPLMNKAPPVTVCQLTIYLTVIIINYTSTIYLILKLSKQGFK